MSTEPSEEIPEEIPEKAPAKKAPEPPAIDEVTIRSYQKTVLFYPTMLVSLILAILEWFFLPYPNILYLIGFVWFVVFAWNLLVISFEFGKGVVVAIVLTIVILILALALVFATTGLVPWIHPTVFQLYVNPYSLLAFAPQFYLHDLPVTSREHATEALAAAKAAGLTRVRLGNMHLLGEPYDHPSCRMA